MLGLLYLIATCLQWMFIAMTLANALTASPLWKAAFNACVHRSKHAHSQARKHANTYDGGRLQVESWKDSRFMLRNHVPVTTLSKEGQESEDLLHNYVEHLRHNCSQLPSILSSDTPASVTSSHFSSGFFQGAHFRLWDDRLTVRGILSFALDHCKSHYRPMHCLL